MIAFEKRFWFSPKILFFKINIYFNILSDIEAQIREFQSRKKEIVNQRDHENDGKMAGENDQVGLGTSVFYDTDIYDRANKFDNMKYSTTVVEDEMEVKLYILNIEKDFQNILLSKFS